LILEGVYMIKSHLLPSTKRSHRPYLFICFNLLVLGLILPSLGFGYGLFLTEDGPLRGGQGRTLLVQTSTGYKVITQGDLSTYFSEDLERKSIYWLLPAFNIENLESATPPSAQIISSAPIDELSELTAPQLQGACEEMPNGEIAVASLPLKSGKIEGGEVFFFNALKLQPPLENPTAPTAFDRFLSNEGLTLSSDLSEAVLWALDQNLMLILVKFEAGLIDGEIDPTLSLNLPLNPIPNYQVTPYFASRGLMGNPSDFIFWILDQDRYRSNFPTRELDFDSVSFVNETQTDYLQWFDVLVQTQQTQIVVTESVSTLSSMTFTDPLLAQIRNENVSTKLTRLRARMSASVLNNNGKIFDFRTANGGNYDRGHRIQGSMCMPLDMEIPDLEIIEDAGIMDQELIDLDPVDQMEESQIDMNMDISQGGMMAEETTPPAPNEGCAQHSLSWNWSFIWVLGCVLWIRRRLSMESRFSTAL
jgi:hypothetical protein